jgi:phosphoglycolate phosphatase-like HAD superfamily hydrolase
MIRILLLDLGGTLTDGQRLFPHVPRALEALRHFENGRGERLALALVSDFGPTPGASPGEVKRSFREYVALLDRLGLKRFFEPVERHVTLSVQVGVRKPDDRIFEAAIQRLGIAAGLGECLFITEDAAHVAAARALGMAALRFGAAGSAGADFDDWSQAPMVVAHLVAPASEHDLRAALRVRLAASHDLSEVSVARRTADGTIHISGRRRVLPQPPPDTLDDVYVEVPVSAKIRLDAQGRVQSVDGADPSPEQIAEASQLVESLEANKQIETGSGRLSPGTTHRVEVDAKGQRVLKRKRFSAI